MLHDHHRSFRCASREFQWRSHRAATVRTDNFQTEPRPLELAQPFATAEHDDVVTEDDTELVAAHHADECDMNDHNAGETHDIRRDDEPNFVHMGSLPGFQSIWRP
jgi:hypothetical protein